MKSKQTAEIEPVPSTVGETTINQLYVVIRGGVRVSDKEYSTIDNPDAIAEKIYWTTIVNKHSHKEKVEIVKYDSKKHKIW